jgi:hypothetical protein
LSEKPYSCGSSSIGSLRSSRPSGSTLAMKWPLTWHRQHRGEGTAKKP